MWPWSSLSSPCAVRRRHRASTSRRFPRSATSTGSCPSGTASALVKGLCWMCRASPWMCGHWMRTRWSRPSWCGPHCPAPVAITGARDFDAIDRAALPAGYRVQLIPQEYAPGGVFERLGRWLDEQAAQSGFYRPYSTWRGGSQPEPWHLSHGPVASQALAQFTPQLLGAGAGQMWSWNSVRRWSVRCRGSSRAMWPTWMRGRSRCGTCAHSCDQARLM